MNHSPSRIRLHRKSAVLELDFPAASFQLPAELLRVHSPSAEVQGHGPGQQQLVAGKKNVAIERIEASGNYGLRIIFDDGHDSGIFTWEYLFRLGDQQDTLMAEYEQKLREAGLLRDPDAQIVKLIDP